MELMKSFYERHSRSVYEQIDSLKQLGLVIENVEEYKKAVAQLSKMTKDQQLVFFMNSFQAEIKC